MLASSNAIRLIKHFEGLELESYLDQASVPTIGYGHTKGVRLGQRISEEEAEDLLREDLSEFERGVSQLTRDVNLHQYQFDALVSFAFNLGLGALRDSTLLRLVRDGKLSASNDFLKWVKIRNPRTGKYEDSPGLVRRRKAEKLLFDTGVVKFG